jgi:transcriptional regulator with XRE-family HTH domain
MHTRRKPEHRSPVRRERIKGMVQFGAIVGHVVARRRAKLGLHQATLAAKLAVTQSAFSRLESGTVPMTVDQLKFIAAALETSAEGILREAELKAKALADHGIRVVFRRQKATDPVLTGGAVAALLLLLARAR